MLKVDAIVAIVTLVSIAGLLGTEAKGEPERELVIRLYLRRAEEITIPVYRMADQSALYHLCTRHACVYERFGRVFHSFRS
jgi:hypothetical protein